VTIVTPSQEPTWGLPDARLLAIVNEKLEQLGVTVVRNRVMREVDTQVKARLSSCACVRACAGSVWRYLSTQQGQREGPWTVGIDNSLGGSGCCVSRGLSRCCRRASSWR
jgi:hypothetical protein